MSIRKGDKLTCSKGVNNIFGMPLFEKGKEYEVLWVDNEKEKSVIVLKHILYANEYSEFDLDFIRKNFKK